MGKRRDIKSWRGGGTGFHFLRNRSFQFTSKLTKLVKIGLTCVDNTGHFVFCPRSHIWEKSLFMVDFS